VNRFTLFKNRRIFNVFRPKTAGLVKGTALPVEQEDADW